jgi:DNA-binding SARP family transcriptional activator
VAHHQVALFGRVRVISGDRVLDDRGFPSRKAKQVFELLALAQGAAVPKERIVELLWGERLPRNPMATLEHTVSILRASCFTGSSPLIVTVSGGYRLDTPVASIDLGRFDQLVRASAHATPPHALQLLRDALALVRGDVLEDEPAAEWATATRQDYRRRVERATIDAARLALLEDDAEVAVVLAEQAQRLAVLPSEEAYHLQASALIRLGRRADALLLLREAETALEREFGAALAPATVALRELLKAPSAGARPAHLRIDIGAFTPARLAPFVGRSAELRRIDAMFDLVRVGGSELVVFEGPNGMGKTRLLDEASRPVDGVGLVRLSGSPSARVLPRFTASRLRRAIGNVQGGTRSTAGGTAGPDAATVLFEQLASSIDEAGPTVAFIDDLHWVDDDSRAILEGLAGPHGVPGFAVVATSRPGSQTARRSPGQTRAELLPLTDAELTAAGFGSTMLVAGVPLLLAAAVEAARANGVLSADTVDAVLARTEEAGALAHEVLVVCAAAGRPVSSYELAYVLGLSADVVAALVVRLECYRLVRRLDAFVELADDVTRQVLVAVIGDDRARSIRVAAGQVPGVAAAQPAEAG